MPLQLDSYRSKSKQEAEEEIMYFGSSDRNESKARKIGWVDKAESLEKPLTN